MVRVLGILFVLVFNCTASAQFYYTITSSPDAAQVYMNGEYLGNTPYRVKFYWHKYRNEKINIEVKSLGYKTWNDSLESKPSKLNFTKSIVLERKYPSYQLDSINTVVGFDKLLADYEDQEVVGKLNNTSEKSTVLKWNGNVKIGSADYGSIFYETMIKSGFKTPFTIKNELFTGNEIRVSTLPRFIVGVRLEDYKVNTSPDEGNDYGAGDIVGTTYMKLKWQILDKRTDQVVSTYTSEDTAHYRMRNNSNYYDNAQAFTDGLIDFVTNSDLYRLVKNSEVSGSTTFVKSDSSRTQYSIYRPTIPQFESRADLIQYAQQACVTIITDGGIGSGVIITPEGYMLSAYHVIKGVNKIQVQFSDGLKLNAKILASDIANDVVLLDIQGSGFTPLPMDTVGDIQLGEEVITIGTPMSIELGQSVARGILSGKRMFDDRILLQSDIAVSPGNSGGPLLNSDGEVIGIIQSKIVGKGVEGIGFAIPIKAAKAALGIR